MIREWRWNEQRAGADGVTLFDNRPAWWSANWASIPAEMPEELRATVATVLEQRKILP